MHPRARATLTRKVTRRPPRPRTFVIGDIHGHREKLDRLVALLLPRANTGDTLLFVGDYIDRGPDSRGVVERLIGLQEDEWPGPVIALKGNHEAMLLDFLSPEPELDPLIWVENGGEATAHSYTAEGWRSDWVGCIPDSHLAFYAGLRLWYRDAHGIYVHAGLKPGTPPEQTTERAALWIREPFINSRYAWDKVVVFGHTPQRSKAPGEDEERWAPLNRAEKIGIDTGVAYGGPLSAVILPKRQFVSVP